MGEEDIPIEDILQAGDVVEGRVMDIKKIGRHKTVELTTLDLPFQTQGTI